MTDCAGYLSRFWVRLPGRTSSAGVVGSPRGGVAIGIRSFRGRTAPPQLVQYLPASACQTAEGSVRRCEHLEGLAQRGGIDGAAPQAVLYPLGETLESTGPTPLPLGSMLRLQELDVVEKVVELVRRETLGGANQAGSQDIVHG